MKVEITCDERYPNYGVTFLRIRKEEVYGPSRWHCYQYFAEMSEDDYLEWKRAEASYEYWQKKLARMEKGV